MSSSFSALSVQFVTNNFAIVEAIATAIAKIIIKINNKYPPFILKNLLYIRQVTFPDTWSSSFNNFPKVSSLALKHSLSISVISLFNKSLFLFSLICLYFSFLIYSS